MKFKNARNATGGSLRNLDTKITASRGLDAYLYNIPYVEGKNFETQSQIMEFLKEQGFRTNPYFYVLENVEQVMNKIEEMVYVRPTLNYDIDGMVVKVDNTEYRERLGYTSKHPKWAIAWKFEAEQEETTLIDFKNETGRTGKITPVGYLKPVEIGGVTVSKATLNNYDWIEERGLKYALGATVVVRRSNDVIPEILGVADGEVGLEIKTPAYCPECNSTLVKDGVHLYCKNHEECPAQQIGKIIHFASRDAMNINTLSHKTIEQLWESGLVRTIVDLYKLKVDDVIGLERFAKRKAEKLIDAIQTSKERPLDAFLYGLAIRHVGQGTVERILRYYDSIEKVMSLPLDELMEIEDIGPSVAESIYRYFHKKENIKMIEELQHLGVRMLHTKQESQSSIFEGMTFVITGTLSKPRKEIETYIKENGGKTSGSVSKKTTYLVAGEDAGSKLDKAREIERKENRKIVLTEEELYKLN